MPGVGVADSAVLVSLDFGEPDYAKIRKNFACWPAAPGLVKLRSLRANANVLILPCMRAAARFRR